MKIKATIPKLGRSSKPLGKLRINTDFQTPLGPVDSEPPKAESRESVCLVGSGITLTVYYKFPQALLILVREHFKAFTLRK